MSKQPSPKYDQLRAMREARFTKAQAAAKPAQKIKKDRKHPINKPVTTP
jgi:hypothetical protein